MSRQLLNLAGLFIILLLITSQAFENHITTYISKQCDVWMTREASSSLNQPKLLSIDEVILTKYAPLQELQLDNLGGNQLLYCDGFNFPKGLKVELTRDGHSCVISGIPQQAQAKTSAYVITANRSGRSLAIVSILVHALVLRE